MDTVRIQDVDVAVLDGPEALLDEVERLRQRGDATVGYVNVHVFEQAHRDVGLTAWLQQLDLCYADGQGVVLASQILGDALPCRMTGADWIHDLAERAASDGWRMAWIGGRHGVTERAAAALTAQHRGLEVVYTDHGYTRGPRTEALIEACNAAEPDIVLVGMGTPAQERWIAEHRHRLDAPVVWALGATADFVSGETSRGPRFLHQRQEWLARLLTEPRRLWKRYLVGNPRFLARVIRSRLSR